MTDVNKLFETGLHKLSTDKLVKLSEMQDILLKKVETANLVYLIQELAARVEILNDTLKQAEDYIEENDKPF